MRRAVWIVAAALAAAVGVVAIVVMVRGGSGDPQARLAARQAEVERRGAEVMPFDQRRTMHEFTKTGSGGVESVTANDPRDTKQTALIRAHLSKERELFAAGDFSDPMAIHGHGMPGIGELQRSAGRITIGYAETANGARLTYSTRDAALVAALHIWFDAQLMDHGSYAAG